MIDSWYYASCVKYHQELLINHHLIYNFLGYYWFSLLKIFKPSVEAIQALNLMNAIGATSCLYVLYACLQKLKNNKSTAFWLTCFCGVSFGFMRYATDAETYILPLLFSLISTYFFIHFKNGKEVFLAGFFASIAILIHQLHMFWAIALLLFFINKRPFSLRQLLLFCAPFLLIPVLYIIAYVYQGESSIGFLQYIIGEYGKGNAHLDISLVSLLLTGVNFMRTFIQIHGNMIYLLNTYHYLSLMIIVIISGWIIYSFFRKNIRTDLFKREIQNDYPKVFLIAFILHLLFAALSSGNAEFMVMLPFLIVLYSGSRYRFNNISLVKSLTVSMFLWNFTAAILPAAFLNLYRTDQQVKTITNNPSAFFLWKNKPLVENKYAYQTGFNHTFNAVNARQFDHRILDSLLAKNIPVYTDIPNTAAAYSREFLLVGAGSFKILSDFDLSPIDSFNNLYGKNYIYLIQKRRD